MKRPVQILRREGLWVAGKDQNGAKEMMPVDTAGKHGILASCLPCLRWLRSVVYIYSSHKMSQENTQTGKKKGLHVLTNSFFLILLPSCFCPEYSELVDLTVP